MTAWQRRQCGPSQPEHHAQMRPAARCRPGNAYGSLIAAAAVLAVAGVGCSSLNGSSSSAPAAATASTAQPTAQPETEAGVRDAATRFYALYAGDLWAQAWQMLTPADRSRVPEATFAAVHQGCPSASDGIARTIKSVTMAGTSAVVMETLAGALGSIATQADTWLYADGQWGFSLTASAMTLYSAGSISADIAAAKEAGDCGALRPLPTMQTIAPATVQPAAAQTLATLPTVAPPALPTASPPPLAPLPTTSS